MPGTNNCECGCCGTTGGGRFLPGHDSKLKSRVALARIPGRAVSYDELYATMWHSQVKHSYRTTRVIATAVHRLRERLGVDCIETLYGYSLRLRS